MTELPEHPEGATDALPGSDAKIARMRRRYLDDCAIFHSGDEWMDRRVEEEQEAGEDKPTVMAHKASDVNGKGLRPSRPPLRR